MMKLVLLFLAITTVSCVSKSSCPIYNCSENAPSTDLGVCAMRDTSGVQVTYTFNKCKSGYSCGTMASVPLLMSMGTVVNCTEDKTLDSFTSAFSDLVTAGTDAIKNVVSNSCDIINASATAHVDGQGCKTNSNCYSTLECNDGVCKGLSNGSSCSSNGYCAKGSACINGTCSNQRGSGEACTNEFECANNMTCGQSKCVSYNSVADGTNVVAMNACSSGRANALVVAGVQITYDCDSYTRNSNDCVGAADMCSYKWGTGADVTGTCLCSGGYNNLQERTCAAVTSMATPTTNNSVQTTLRYTQDIKNCDVVIPKVTFGTCIDNVFGATAFIRNSMFVILSVLAILF
jgi:hypothetical protein